MNDLDSKVSNAGLHATKPRRFGTPWLKQLFYVIGDNEAAFVLALVLGFLSNAFISAANPLALKYLFDEGIIKKNFSLFIVLSGTFVSLFTLWRLLNLCSVLYVTKLKNRILENLCLKMLAKYYGLPYAEIIRKETGYFISRVYDELSTAGLSLVDSIFVLFNTAISLVVALGLAVSFSLKASSILLVVIPVIIYCSHRFTARIRTQSKYEKEEEATLRGLLGRALASYKVTRTFNLYDKIYSRIWRQLRKFNDTYYSRFKTSSIYQTLAGVSLSYAEAAVIVVGGYEILARRMTFGTFMAFMSAFWIVMAASKGLFEQITEISRVTASLERITEFGVNAVEKHVPHFDGIRLEGLAFAYNEKKVLRNIYLEAKKGDRILVVGPNGVGKSTLAHIIAGFLCPTVGELKTLPLERISAVIFPFHFVPGTVIDNVTFDHIDGKQELLSELAHEFELDEVLDKDPVELSAGQRKKVEVMMGLLKEADLYVFDEPFSHLDQTGRGKILGAILRRTENKMLILISNDESCSECFDKVIRLEASGELETSTQDDVVAPRPEELHATSRV